MPSPISDETSKHVFRIANEKLKNLCIGHENISFLDISKQFIKGSDIDETLFEDDVHLSLKGASLYARCVKSHLFWLKFWYLNKHLWM